jgi:predicted AAA+ superfamily ATPase
MNLPSWRQVIHPHRDVAEGRYRQAEFAADLAEVLAGTAEPEYQDPAEFFHRTYLTHGIRQLLGASLQRVGGKGGEPVVQLKTAFGGGKTHTMLALYHLLSGKPGVEKIASVRELVEAAGLAELPQARFAVLDGTDLDPAKPRKHAKLGISTRTLWGEMALQIGGKEGYEMLRASDEAGTAPGTAEIKELFDKYGPCVVLVDELVAYVRNLVGVTKNLPGGSYDANITFTQRLTQAAKRSTNSLVVASIPESDIEIGGAPGQAALEAIEHHIGRIEAVWKPVAAEEGFEIVRRRLFAEVEDEAARERVCRAYQKMYKDAGAEFPTEAASNDYLARMLQSYPIHPEVFDRLYDDWGTLERFQKTRGVLRLMAAVIHELWTRQDAGSMILPGSIPLDAPRVREELTRYLPEPWGNVVDKDVDGERSEPAKLDRSNQRLGDLMAARRVARAIFMGSAPSVRQQKVRGIQEVRVRLGVVQPGEHTAVYTDALGRLTQNLTHLYSGEGRYWYDTTPNLRKTVEDKAREFESHQVLDELVRRLRLVRDKGDFDAVPVCAGPADVPD